LPKLVFFDILVVLKLDRGQISFSLLENSLVARQLAVLATRIAFRRQWVKLLFSGFLQSKGNFVGVQKNSKYPD